MDPIFVISNLATDEIIFRGSILTIDNIKELSTTYNLQYDDMGISIIE